MLALSDLESLAAFADKFFFKSKFVVNHLEHLEMMKFKRKKRMVERTRESREAKEKK